MDQLMLSNEKEKTYKANTALGGMVTLSYARSEGSVIRKFYIEGAYTTPYLYRNAKYTYDETTGIYIQEYNHDFLLGYFRMTAAGGYAADFNVSAMQAELEYTGLTPDTIAIQTGAVYKDYARKLTVNMLLRYQVQGALAYDNIIYPDYDPANKGSGEAGMTPSSAAVHTISITGLSSYSVNSMLDIYAGLYLGWSFGYIQAFTPQAYFGLTLNLC